METGSAATGPMDDGGPLEPVVADRPTEPAISTSDYGASEMLVKWAFSPGADAPRAARALVTEALAGSGETVDLLVLMVSELVTNAVMHTHRGAEFRLIDLGPLGLRVEVEDLDSHLPARSAHPGAGGGYGLRIIDSFARSWGTSMFPTHAGKVVWFEIDHP